MTILDEQPLPRMSSGHRHMDEVLGGGLLGDSITVLAGLPGSGKTLLAQQYVFTNATDAAPAVYLTTVSEPLDKLLRYGQELDFFDISAINRSVFYEDAGQVLAETGLAGVLDLVGRMLATRRPSVIVIDSFKALRGYAVDDGEFRRFLYDLAARLAAQPVTALWLGEYTDAEIAEGPEFAVADAILRMGTNAQAERRTRVFTVLELRGSGFLSGQHAYRLSSAGVDLFPRLADSNDGVRYGLDVERVSSGIAGLDKMLGGGYVPGSAILIAGPPGTGKTIAGLKFLTDGAERGERGLIAAMQENPSQLTRVAETLGWRMPPELIDVVHHVPVDLYIDEWIYDILGRIEGGNVTRLVIDSLGDLQNAAPDPRRFQEMFYSLVQRCSRLGVTVVMTLEIQDFFGATRLSDNGVSHLSDSVILLQYVRAKSEVKRALTVLKARASSHDMSIRQFSITGSGIEIGEVFSVDQDLR